MKKYLIVAAVLASFHSGTAGAATLYENAPVLDASQDGSCYYGTFCANDLAPGTNVYAAQTFSLAQNSNVSGFGFNAIVFGNVYGTSVNYEVRSVTGGMAPGAIITSGSAALANSVGPQGQNYATTNYSFDIPTLNLASGDYVFVFQSVTSQFDDYLSVGVASSGAFETLNGGASFTQGYRGNPSVAISVFGTAAAAPEPATWALMILGFGAVGTALRRSRRKAAIGLA